MAKQQQAGGNSGDDTTQQTQQTQQDAGNTPVTDGTEKTQQTQVLPSDEDDFQFGAPTENNNTDTGTEETDQPFKKGDEYLVEGKKVDDGTYEQEDGSKVTVKDGVVETYEPFIEPLKTGDEVQIDGKKADDGDYNQPDGSIITVKEGKVEKVTPAVGATDDFIIPSDQQQQQVSAGQFDYVGFAKKAGLDITENSETAYAVALEKKLEAQRQQLNLDGYNEESKALINFLNKDGGSYEDFINNPQVIQMQAVLAMDPESKLRQVMITEKVNHEKMSAEEASEAVDKELDEMSTRQIKDEADGIDQEAREIIKKETVKIIGDKKVAADQEKNRIFEQEKTERQNLVEFVNKQDSYLGLKITPEAKATIIRDINTGEFDKVIKNNNVSSKFYAYLNAKFGNNILSRIENVKKKAAQEGFNDSQVKNLKALHRIPASQGQSGATGHTPASGGKKTFDSWKDSNLF